MLRLQLGGIYHHQPRSLDLTKLFVYFQLELTRVAVVHVAANTVDPPRSSYFEHTLSHTHSRGKKLSN